MKYEILLFYKYVNIADPEAERLRQMDLCTKYDLKCRIIVAKEGINGTLEGTIENTQSYIDEMISDARFADIDWKRSEGTGSAFPKVKIKVRDEIVTLGLGERDIDPNKTSGRYITADELHELYSSGNEFYIVDMRNDYEQAVGHFENAILMPISNFRELPETLEEIEHLKDKLVVTTCTGGIRCEKASGFLVDNGFSNVYQLYGGMQTYMEKYPNQHFLGKLYVFDGRVVWGVNSEDPGHRVVSSCLLCGNESELYVDCGYIHCDSEHRHFIACKECVDQDGRIYCSDKCRQLSQAVEIPSTDTIVQENAEVI